MNKNEVWSSADGTTVELYRSSYNPGNRNSLTARRSTVRYRGTGSTPQVRLGVNDFSNAADARAFLASKGFVRTR